MLFSRWSVLAERAATVARVLRGVLGVPDYARYVAHVERHHAGAEPMSEREFARRCLQEKYARPGSRCC